MIDPPVPTEALSGALQVALPASSMVPLPAGRPPAFGITRERLADGSMLAALRANAPKGTVIRSDAELEASLEQTLAECAAGEDIYVFGYGSLIWNPAFHFSERSRAFVHGWSRRFCIWMNFARGTPEQPGLMLALDRGGACIGVAFRIPSAQSKEELGLLWRREMLTGVYDARWVTASMNDKTVRALTFVANRKHARYASGLNAGQMADYIATAEGHLGTCLAYFDATVAALDELRIKDAGLHRLQLALHERKPTRPEPLAGNDRY